MYYGNVDLRKMSSESHPRMGYIKYLNGNDLIGICESSGRL